MSDQLSKVDECLRSLPDLWERTADACSEPAAAHAIRCCANELQLRIATIDPAAGPVEVEEVADDLDALEQLESDIDGMADCTERVRSHIATLARQLAEAKAENERLYEIEAAAVKVEEDANTFAAELERWAHDPFVCLTPMRIEDVKHHATRIRAIACNLAGARHSKHKQAESALAAATRRVAEVEAERDELRQAAHGLRFDVFSLTTHELQAAFDGKQSIAVVDMDTVAALKAALQKEPK